jgi:hypothetical protein
MMEDNHSKTGALLETKSDSEKLRATINLTTKVSTPQPKSSVTRNNNHSQSLEQVMVISLHHGFI